VLEERLFRAGPMNRRGRLGDAAGGAAATEEPGRGARSVTHIPVSIPACTPVAP